VWLWSSGAFQDGAMGFSSLSDAMEAPEDCGQDPNTRFRAF